MDKRTSGNACRLARRNAYLTRLWIVLKLTLSNDIQILVEGRAYVGFKSGPEIFPFNCKNTHEPNSQHSSVKAP